MKVGEATELCYSPKWCGHSVRLSLVHVIGVIVHSFEAKLCRARALKVDPWTAVKVGEATKPFYCPKWSGYSVRFSFVHLIGVIVHSFEPNLVTVLNGVHIRYVYRLFTSPESLCTALRLNFAGHVR